MPRAEAVPSSSMTTKELISYLDPDLFIPSLKATSKRDAIHKMVDHLVEKKRIRDGKIVRELLKTREKLGSTGIGKGVAVPHSRSTVTNSLTLLCARSEEGIDFDAPDNKPVHLFFLILAPHQDKSNVYLPLLGKLVEVTRYATVRKKLLKADDVEGWARVLEQAKTK